MLTREQQLTIKAAIEANPEWNAQPDNSEGAYNLAVIFNTVAEPAFYVWRTSVSVNEIMGNGFDWARVDNIDNAKARIWEWMTQLGTINPLQTNVRAGINAAFPTLANSAMRLAIFSHCQRAATVIEKMFATGNGTTTTDAGVGPGTAVFVGPISSYDVENSRRITV